CAPSIFAPRPGLDPRPGGRSPAVRRAARAPDFDHTGTVAEAPANPPVASAGAGSLLGFLFWALAARSYPDESVGRNFVLISAMMVASSASQLGLGGVLVRYLPGAGASTRALVVRAYALTGVLAAAIGLGVALTADRWSSGTGFLGDG